MGDHFRTYSAIFPIVLRQNDGITQILLHRRKNTGFQDGKLDMAGSGHVDEGETAKMAVVRECAEELGISIKIEDLKFAHLSHRVGKKDARTYYDIYFVVDKYEGTPMIKEPDKCSELLWFNLSDLPEDVIEIRKIDLANYKNSIFYSEKIEA